MRSDPPILSAPNKLPKLGAGRPRHLHVIYTVARARWGVGPHSGFTVIATPGALSSPVKPGVWHTPGPLWFGEARGGVQGVAPGGVVHYPCAAATAEGRPATALILFVSDTYVCELVRST